jgi:hypothetical protein
MHSLTLPDGRTVVIGRETFYAAVPSRSIVGGTDFLLESGVRVASTVSYPLGVADVCNGLITVTPTNYNLSGTGFTTIFLNTYFIREVELHDATGGSVIEMTVANRVPYFVTESPAAIAVLAATAACFGGGGGGTFTALSGEATSTGTGGATTLSNSAVIGKVLTGFTSGAGTLAATDSILQAIQKLDGNVAASTAIAESPDTNTFVESTNTGINFQVNGVSVGTVTETAGVPKWTLNGILDPTVYAGTPITTAARNALTPVEGYLIYNTTTDQYEFYNGSTWLPVGSSLLAYTTTSAYKTGDQRIYRSVSIEANGTIAANTAFSWGTTGATWKPIVPTGYTWQGVWAIGTVYATNDVVTLSTTSNELFFAKLGNTGNDPASTGNPYWNDFRFIDFDTFSGASTSFGGRIGLVPQPFAGQTDGFLRSDGDFSVPALGTILVANKPVGGNLHTTSTTTPDYIDRYVVTQTTAGQTMTVANASTTYNRGRLIYVQNSSASTASFTMYGKVVNIGKFIALYWTGTTWTPIAFDGSLNVVEDKAALAALATPADMDVVFVQDSTGLNPGVFIYDSARAFGDVEPSTIQKKIVTFDDVTDVITTSTPHTYTAGTIVRFSDTAPASPLSTNTATTDYYIINPTATTFQVSLTNGGAAVNLTSPGSPFNTHYVSTKGGWFYPVSQVSDKFHQFWTYDEYQTDATTVFKVGDWVVVQHPRQSFQVTKAGTGFANISTQPVFYDPQGLELSDGYQFSDSFVPDVAKFGRDYYGAIFSSSSQPLVIGAVLNNGAGPFFPSPGEKIRFVIFNMEATDKVVQFDSSWKDSTGTAMANQTVPANGQIRLDFEGTWAGGSLTELRQVLAGGIVANVGAWAATTTYKAGTYVKLNGVVYQRIADGTSGATFNGTEAAFWNVISIDSTTASWAASTYYPLGQQVQEGFRILERTVAGVSDALSFTNTEAPNWKLISQKNFQSPWVANGYYYQGEKVLSENRTIQKLASGLSGATFNAIEAALWTPVTPLKAGTTWAASTYYYAGDVVEVSADGIFIKRLAGGMSGATFDNTEKALWSLVSTTTLAVWTPLTYYYVGQEVLISNKILRQLVGATSLATYDGLETLNWEMVYSSVTAWQPSTFYYTDEEFTNNGVIYKRTNSGVSQATFDSTEEGFCVRVGTVENNPKTITAATYTVLANDGIIVIDSTANAVDVTFPSTLQDGKMYVIQYVQTANTITVTAGAGTTIVSPTTYLPVASYTAPGSVGQYGTTQIFKINNVWNFVG